MNTPRRSPDTVIAHNLKNYPSTTWLQYAHLNLVSIILVEFHEIPTNGFQEIVFTKMSTDGLTNEPNDRLTDRQRESYIAPINFVSYTPYLGV